MNLKDVALQDNQIADVSSLVAMTSLGELNVRNNGIVDLSLLTELTNIEILHSEGNPAVPLRNVNCPGPPLYPGLKPVNIHPSSDHGLPSETVHLYYRDFRGYQRMSL